jgi:hypothetical protein
MIQSNIIYDTFLAFKLYKAIKQGHLTSNKKSFIIITLKKNLITVGFIRNCEVEMIEGFMKILLCFQ